MTNQVEIDPLKIADKTFQSRLLLGTGKFSSPELMKNSILASKAEIITTAIRRVNLKSHQDNFITHIRSICIESRGPIKRNHRFAIINHMFYF